MLAYVHQKGELKMSNIKTEVSELVAKKVGIPKDKAQQAVDVVLKFLKEKLPPTVAGQLNAVLDGNVDLSDGIGLDDAAGLLGGLLGGKK
jgi:ATP-dependent Clp protease ATP-binding subunit ClpA